MLRQQTQQPQKSNVPPRCTTSNVLIDTSNGPPRQYQIVKYLGVGGFAQAAHVVSVNSRMDYAAKLNHMSWLGQTKVAKLMTEIKVHQRCKHQYVCRLLRTFEYYPFKVILLELCERGSLMDLYKSRIARRINFTEMETRYFMWQILDGIAYLHSQFIIHRDLKLANIFLNKNYEVKIGDFGLATLLRSEDERKHTFCGTPNYISPEVLNSGQQNSQGHSWGVDVWSFGVMMWTLLFGKPTFETNLLESTYNKIKATQFTFPQTPQVSDEAKDLLSRIFVPEAHRITPQEMRKHPFFTQHHFPVVLDSNINLNETSVDHYYSKYSFTPVQCGPIPNYPKPADVQLSAKETRDLQQQQQQPQQPASNSILPHPRPQHQYHGQYQQQQQTKLTVPLQHPQQQGQEQLQPIQQQQQRMVANFSAPIKPVLQQASINENHTSLQPVRQMKTSTNQQHETLQSQMAPIKSQYSQNILPSQPSQMSTQTRSHLSAPIIPAQPAVHKTSFNQNQHPTHGGLQVAHHSQPTNTHHSNQMTDDISSGPTRSQTPPQSSGLEQWNPPRLSLPRPIILPPDQRHAELWVNVYVDYVERYGFAYMLSNGTCGVLFNDSTTMLLHGDGVNCQYIIMVPNEIPKVTHFTLGHNSPDLQKKASLLVHFNNILVQRIMESRDNEADSCSPYPGRPDWRTFSLPFDLSTKDTTSLTCLKSHHTANGVVAIRLTNRTTQLIFTDQDERDELMVDSENNIVVYTDQSGVRTMASLLNWETTVTDRAMIGRLRFVQSLYPRVLDSTQFSRSRNYKPRPVNIHA